jgi:hypothetical protein
MLAGSDIECHVQVHSDDGWGSCVKYEATAGCISDHQENYLRGCRAVVGGHHERVQFYLGPNCVLGQLGAEAAHRGCSAGTVLAGTGSGSYHRNRLQFPQEHLDLDYFVTSRPWTVSWCATRSFDVQNNLFLRNLTIIFKMAEVVEREERLLCQWMYGLKVKRMMCVSASTSPSSSATLAPMRSSAVVLVVTNRRARTLVLVHCQQRLHFCVVSY